MHKFIVVLFIALSCLSLATPQGWAQSRPKTGKAPLISSTVQESVDAFEDRAVSDRNKLTTLKTWQQSFQDLQKDEKALVIKSVTESIAGDYTGLSVRVEAVLVLQRLYHTVDATTRKTLQELFSTQSKNDATEVEVRLVCLQALGELGLEKSIALLLRDMKKEDALTGDEAGARIGAIAYRYLALSSSDRLSEALDFFVASLSLDKSGALFTDVADNLLAIEAGFANDAQASSQITTTVLKVIEVLLKAIPNEMNGGSTANANRIAASFSALAQLVTAETLECNPQLHATLAAKATPFLLTNVFQVSANASGLLVALLQNSSAATSAQASNTILESLAYPLSRAGDNATMAMVISMVHLVVRKSTKLEGESQIYAQYATPVARQMALAMRIGMTDRQSVSPGKSKIVLQGLAQLLLALVPEEAWDAQWFEDADPSPNQRWAQIVPDGKIAELFKSAVQLNPATFDVGQRREWNRVREIGVYGLAAYCMTEDGSGQDGLSLMAELFGSAVVAEEIANAAFWGIVQRLIYLDHIRIKESVRADMQAFNQMSSEFKTNLNKGLNLMRNSHSLAQGLGEQEIWGLAFLSMLSDDPAIKSWFESAEVFNTTLNLNGKDVSIREWLKSIN